MHYETIWYSILLSCCYCIIHQKNKYSCCCFFTLYCKKKNFKMDFNSIKSKLSIVTGLRWSAFFLALRAAVHLGFFYCSRIHCLFRYFFLFFYSHLFCLEWKVSKKSGLICHNGEGRSRTLQCAVQHFGMHAEICIVCSIYTYIQHQQLLFLFTKNWITGID